MAPDGTHAAFGMGWADSANHKAEFEPVDTRPTCRQMGLGRAVLPAGLNRLRARGVASVLVGPVKAGDQAILQLYHSAGFRALRRLFCYLAEY